MASVLPPVDPAELLAGLERWVTALRVRGLGDEEPLKHLQTVLAQAHGERLNVPVDPLLVVMFCGPTAVGKSSLINAIAGAEISSPGLGATTHTAVFYVHEEDDLMRLFEYGEVVGQWAQHPYAVIRHQRDALRHKVLVDTPDIDSAVRQHQEVTATLVHTADLVVFVTTPEKYKTMQAAHWVAQQRQQRALAFVLHKWDREGIGLQYEQRDVVAEDFRHLLAASGFASPILFKVSSLYGAAPLQTEASQAGDEDNQLAALHAWIETGLHQSMATTIQHRRRRAAWGRLAAAVTAVLPTPLGSAPWVSTATTALEHTHQEGRRLVQSNAAALATDYTGSAVWPSTPGLFGIYARFLTWCASLRATWRGVGRPWSAWPGLAGQPSDGAEPAPKSPAAPWEGEMFGAVVARLLGEVTERLLADVATRRLPLQPVRVGWTAAVAQLLARVAAMPTRVEHDLVATAMQLSVRRVLGITALTVVEGLLVLVLVLVFWRVATGFIVGTYADVSLLLSAVTLLGTLILGGHFLANLFFPPLRHRFQAELTRRALAAVDTAWETALDVLQEHVAAVDHLAAQGQETLRAIDCIVHSLTQTAVDDDQVQRLFGDAAVSGVEAAAPPRERQRLPQFD